MVTIRWSLNSHHALIQIVDNGPGLLNPQNAFLPFYTTKGAGSGIGLVLCRQIVEAHGGPTALVDRSDGSGCIATIAMAARLVARQEFICRTPQTSN